jgi:choline dehydrogenase-like flavoprotein
VLRDELVRDSGWHLMGTARMGDDPATSVVDRWGRAHDVRNLFVVDGSVFVTGAAVNPTTTIQALALRTAEWLGQQFGEVAA